VYNVSRRLTNVELKVGTERVSLVAAGRVAEVSDALELGLGSDGAVSHVREIVAILEGNSLGPDGRSVHRLGETGTLLAAVS